MKNKILGDIKNDFGWYTNIIFKRICRILTRTHPVYYLGWLLLPLMAFFIYRKKYFNLYVLLISLPLSATSLIIYSGDGTTNNSVFGFFVVIFIIELIYTFIANKINIAHAKNDHSVLNNKV